MLFTTTLTIKAKTLQKELSKKIDAIPRQQQSTK